MKFLIYGAGVIGSIFAGKLASSGCDVTVLARGKRFNELKKHGVILMRPGAKKQEQIFVKVIDALIPEDIYDYIIVVMQRTQVDTVLPVLSQNKSPNIVFVVNTAAGYDSWVEAVGGKRLMFGFPSAGGERQNGQVNYFIGKGFMRIFQTTTFAEYSGKITQRLDAIVQIFRKAGIPAVTTLNMDNWQKNHVAMVTSIGNALYKYDGDNYALSHSYKDVRLMISGIKEGFSVLNQLGIQITPTKLYFFKLPTGMLAIIFKVFMGTKLAEITMAKHTVAAKDEMKALQDEFDILIRKSGMITPSINQLRKNLIF